MRQLIKNMVPVVLAVTVVLSGCDDQLNIDPAQSIGEDIALSTSENVQAVLVGAYDGLSDTDVYGGNPTFEADLLADDEEVRWVGSFEEPEQIWLKRIQVENGDVEDAWTDAYDVINIINNVLSALDVVDESERDRVEGEALFLRGLIYFQLAELFGQPWSAGNQSSNLAVPLITEPTRSIDESANVSRNTVADVYALVLDDLTRAEDLLPATNGEFATSNAVAAILSRVYLQQGDFANARDAANRVIASGQFSLVGNYANEFQRPDDSSEDIFTIQISATDGANNLNLFYAPDEFSGRGDIDILQAHLDLYEDGDDRLALFFEDESGTLRTGKWVNVFGNIPVIRLGEMYLTRAEGNLEEGTAIGATPTEDVNRIRNRAGLDDLSVAIDKDAILFERRLELAFEGQMLHDIKRTQRDVGSFPFDAPELVYPVPQRELDVNPNLVQNAGYGG